MRLAAPAIAIAVTCSACSFMFVRGSSKRAPGDPGPPSCTSLPIAPAIDTALVVLAVIGAYTAHSKLSDREPGSDINYDFLRIQRDWSIVGGVLELGAATYGWVRTTRCRRAKDEYWATTAAR